MSFRVRMILYGPSFRDVAIRCALMIWSLGVIASVIQELAR